MRYVLLVLCPLLASGCSSLLTEGTSDAAGIAGAGIAGSVTKDATVGAGIGLGVKSLADAGLRYAQRRVHGAEQNEIAGIAGPLPVGAVRPWGIAHDVPIEPDEHGEVVVARDIGGPGLACREIVFSVEAGERQVSRGFFTATICRDGTQWKWATAEPATARWSGLQ
ncbi:MAG TPA: hypothetical protein VHS58_19975 [Acetobacteraceae bacterium]|jgi:hypothetical protein|nr:hypothetical protein [Acetobacteraceae bacterium]